MQAPTWCPARWCSVHSRSEQPPPLHPRIPSSPPGETVCPRLPPASSPHPEEPRGCGPSLWTRLFWTFHVIGTLRDVFRDWLLSLNTMTSSSLGLFRCGAGPCSVCPSSADRRLGGCREHACAGWGEDVRFRLLWAHVCLGWAGLPGHTEALCVRPCGTDTPFPSAVPFCIPSGSA